MFTGVYQGCSGSPNPPQLATITQITETDGNLKQKSDFQDKVGRQGVCGVDGPDFPKINGDM